MSKDELISYAKSNIREAECEIEKAEYALKQAQRKLRELLLKKESFQKLFQILETESED
jgi:hypothetical protein